MQLLQNKIFVLLLIIPVITLAIFSSAYSQIKGVERPAFNPDTVFVFKSPRPLVEDNKISGALIYAWGPDIIFSNNGFGAGLFYLRNITEHTFAFCSLYISGARNTDELEQYMIENNALVLKVPNKINRLYMFPLTFGLQQYVLPATFTENLKPYAQIGLGPTFILATPYDREFFNAFGYSTSYTRFGGFLGIGANVMSGDNSIVSVNIRYYYIPFGKNGLESIRNLPIKDFGGLFLSASIGVTN